MENVSVDEIKRRIKPILKKSDVLRSSIFGSAARGELSAESDIDILIEFPKGKTLLDLVELKIQLERALGRNIDILTYKSIHPLLKDSIRQNEVSIL